LEIQDRRREREVSKRKDKLPKGDRLGVSIEPIPQIDQEEESSAAYYTLDNQYKSQ